NESPEVRGGRSITQGILSLANACQKVAPVKSLHNSFGRSIGPGKISERARLFRKWRNVAADPLKAECQNQFADTDQLFQLLRGFCCQRLTVGIRAHNR